MKLYFTHTEKHKHANTRVYFLTTCGATNGLHSVSNGNLLDWHSWPADELLSLRLFSLLF